MWMLTQRHRTQAGLRHSGAWSKSDCGENRRRNPAVFLVMRTKHVCQSPQIPVACELRDTRNKTACDLPRKGATCGRKSATASHGDNYGENLSDIQTARPHARLSR